MVATPFGGEFNRLDRDGDYMEGNLQLLDVTNPTIQSILEFIATVGGPMVGGVRQNGNDLEFYDTTVGAWVKLSQLTGHLGDIHYVTPGAGQTLFNLPFIYTVGSDTLSVYLITTGKIPGPGAGAFAAYAETSPTSVTFNTPFPPYTPFTGTELLCFHVPGRPIVNDTYQVKVDAGDTPDWLENQIVDAGVAQAAAVSKVAGQMQVSVPLTTTTPAQSTGAGAVGTEVTPARGDHVHPAPPQDPPLGSATPLIESGTGSPGVSTNASREDHVHPAAASGLATFLYEEQNHPGGAGPTHLITLATGSYSVGSGQLNVMVGGLVVPRSLIQELTPTTFNILNWGPIAANTKIVALVPKGRAETGLTNALYEIQIAGAGQTIFNLTTGTYAPNQNELIVIIGTSFIQNTAYNETSPTQVVLKAPGAGGPPVLPAGTPVLFMVPQGATPGGQSVIGETSAHIYRTLVNATLLTWTWPAGAAKLKLFYGCGMDQTGGGTASCGGSGVASIDISAQTIDHCASSYGSTGGLGWASSGNGVSPVQGTVIQRVFGTIGVGFGALDIQTINFTTRQLVVRAQSATPVYLNAHINVEAWG